MPTEHTPTPDASAKLAVVAFTSLIAGIALTAVFFWFDPFHVFGAATGGEFRSYRDAAGTADQDLHTGHDHDPVAYSCSMHPEVLVDEPGYCPICNMRLTPVGGREPAGDVENGVIELTPAVMKRMNVRTAIAERRDLDRRLRTVGYLEYDQERVATITTKYRGFVEKVFVANVGAPVRRGQALFAIYSPELVQTQQELLSAVAFAKRMEVAPKEARTRAASLVEAARTRLGYWDMAPEKIDQLVAGGKVFRDLTVHSPRDGLVMQITPGLEGMKIDSGTPTFHIADLSTLWLSVEIFEDQVASIHEGTPATVTFGAFPGEVFRGAVRYLEPALSEATRTLGVKIAVPNPDRKLRAGMFATVVLSLRAAENAIVIPTEAVLRTGTRQLVIVEAQAGRFSPRNVALGLESEGLIEILDGLDAGEVVVTSAQFLLDSEANLRAAIARLGQGGDPATPDIGHQH